MFSSAVNSACMVMLGASYGPSTVIYFDDFYMEAVNMSTEGILSHFYLYFILYYLIVSFYSFHVSNSFFFFLSLLILTLSPFLSQVSCGTSSLSTPRPPLPQWYVFLPLASPLLSFHLSPPVPSSPLLCPLLSFLFVNTLYRLSQKASCSLTSTVKAPSSARSP